MDAMSESRAAPLPPARSRRTAAFTAEAARADAPLPPYVPGRTATAAPQFAAEEVAPGTASHDVAPPEETATVTAEPGPREVFEEAPVSVEPSFEPGESWIVGGTAGEAEETGADVIAGMGEAWESGDDFPFEGGAAATAADDLELEAVEPEAAPSEAGEDESPDAFPWETPPAEVESEEPAGAAMEADSQRQEGGALQRDDDVAVAGAASEAAAAAGTEALSPWEDLREAAARSIAVPEMGGITASLGIETATQSADTLAGEFAERLEVLAERLRTEGLRAIDRALAEGDRLDAAVAGFLTGLLANREK